MFGVSMRYIQLNHHIIAQEVLHARSQQQQFTLFLRLSHRTDRYSVFVRLLSGQPNETPRAGSPPYVSNTTVLSQHSMTPTPPSSLKTIFGFR